MSAASTTTRPAAGQPLQIGRWSGGRTWVVAGGGAGVLFLLATVAAMFMSPGAWAGPSVPGGSLQKPAAFTT